MSTLTPHQSLALSTKGHLALTANAGSGKTFVLARKYLDALVKDKLDISSVAAITFTEKAASELYLKISILIDEKLKECKDLADKKQLEKVRRQLVSANISTIHSFCISILRDYPVEAQLDARFIPIDEKLSEELIELSVEEMIRSSFNDELVSEELKYLIRIFASKSKLQNQIVKLIKNRKNVFTLQENIYSLDEKTIADYFSKSFADGFINIWKQKENDFIKLIQIINSHVLEDDNSNKIALDIQSEINELNHQNNVYSILNAIKSIKLLAFTDRFTIRKRGYLSNDLSKLLVNEIQEMESIIDEFKNFDFLENSNDVEFELARFGKTFLSFFDYALRNYETKKRVDGYIDYEDILLHTKLLLQNINVQKSLAKKFKLLMVDEFQDTNEIQYQIFLPILDELKSGRLFIVGDEKQSIYKFRDAEIAIFNLTRNDIKKSVGVANLLVLPDSFRMAPYICAFCNHIFKELFKEPDEQFGEVPATDLVCARVDDTKGKVEFLVSKIDEDVTSFSEAELIAGKILEIMKEGNYSYNDISILVRKRKHFTDLEKIFLKYEIPFTIIGGRGFYQRQTISDIYNYLSFLADKNNNTALVGVLRSPFFSISDSKLYDLSLESSRSYWTKLKNIVDDEEIVDAFNILKENLALSSSISLPQIIYKIITDKNYLSILSARNDGEQEVSNIAKLVNIARNFNASGFRNLYDFLNYLKDSIANQDDESQAGISSNNNAVQMMTIHQSKGLEFPIVFLVKTEESGLSSSIKSGEVKIDKNFGLLTKVPLNQNYFEDYNSAPITALHNYYEEKKNNAELKRLLYVAVTRAKDELYITSTIKKESVFKKDSFLNLMSSALRNDFNSAEIFIKEKLELLSLENDKYINRDENIQLSIPITTEINFTEQPKKFIEKVNVKVDVNISALASQEKGEIISASKVSIYSQCPLKYLLTYDYGFSKLNSDYKTHDNKSFQNYINDFPEDEDNLLDYKFESTATKVQSSDTALYGKIFHKVMEESVSFEKLDDFIKYQVESNIVNSSEPEILINRLKNDLSNYYKSKTWEEISKSKNYKNEFEIYVKENDYYLHGIIDKIIFIENKVLIYDYKTDEIDKKEIKKHSEYYLMQLKFYLYIASRLFTQFNTFQGSLIFIKHPDDIVTLSFSKDEIKNLEKEIAVIIESIRNKNSEKNYSHCKVCSFSSSSNKCIIN